MRNFRIVLQYEGTRYQGWQKQDTTDNTIQGKLEALLEKMCAKPVEIIGSGRTDAGVHARAQIANFKIDTEMSSEEIMEYMNTYLPEDIAVVKIAEAAERFHSRLNATGKTYEYRVINSKIPHVFDRKYTFMVEEALNVEAMKTAAEKLTGTHDYKAFTSTKKGKKSSVRTVTKIEIKEYPDDEIRFTFEGDGFLYHMVRIMTGTLLEVGKGTLKPEDMERILESGLREKAGPLVPGKGLTLLEVRYS